MYRPSPEELLMQGEALVFAGRTCITWELYLFVSGADGNKSGL